MDSLSANIAAKNLTLPVLIIHDNQDEDVPIKCAININKHLKNGELMITNGLGHRKILADEIVIEKIINFVKE